MPLGDKRQGVQHRRQQVPDGENLAECESRVARPFSPDRREERNRQRQQKGKRQRGERPRQRPVSAQIAPAIPYRIEQKCASKDDDLDAEIEERGRLVAERKNRARVLDLVG